MERLVIRLFAAVFITGFDLCELVARVTVIHERSTADVDHVVMPSVRNEMPRESGIADATRWKPTPV
jgi:hypothetical protein